MSELGSLRRGQKTAGDCLNLLSGVPAGVVETIWLDWPYSQASPVRGKDDGAAARIFGPVSFLVRVLQELHRAAAVGCHLYLFGDWRGIPDAGYCLSLSGWYPKTIIAWDKCYVGTGSFWRSSWDPIFFASKGPADKRTDKALPNVIRTPAVRGGRSHPYEKPPELWEKLCEVSASEGSIIVDPFAGSGSSQPPSEAAGGLWHGIDVDPNYAVTLHQPTWPSYDALIEEEF